NALAWAVERIDAEEIDNINILKASILCMHKALDNLSIIPEHIIIDGNKFIKYRDIEYKTIVKGDGKYLSIAAASVLAKTHRDDYMSYLHSQYPHYQWNINKGYPTPKHRQAIKEFGISPYHRRSFKLLDTQTSINFDC
ncbi:MAG: ribonuclease HII, partial [Prevotella sp.]